MLLKEVVVEFGTLISCDLLRSVWVKSLIRYLIYLLSGFHPVPCLSFPQGRTAHSLYAAKKSPCRWDCILYLHLNGRNVFVLLVCNTQNSWFLSQRIRLVSDIALYNVCNRFILSSLRLRIAGKISFFFFTVRFLISR